MPTISKPTLLILVIFFSVPVFADLSTFHIPPECPGCPRFNRSFGIDPRFFARDLGTKAGISLQLAIVYFKNRLTHPQQFNDLSAKDKDFQSALDAVNNATALFAKAANVSGLSPHFSERTMARSFNYKEISADPFYSDQETFNIIAKLLSQCNWSGILSLMSQKCETLGHQLAALNTDHSSEAINRVSAAIDELTRLGVYSTKLAALIYK